MDVQEQEIRDRLAQWQADTTYTQTSPLREDLLWITYKRDVAHLLQIIDDLRKDQGRPSAG